MCRGRDGAMAGTSEPEPGSGAAVSDVAIPMLVMTLSLTPHALTETAATATTIDIANGVRERQVCTISKVPAAIRHSPRRESYAIVAVSSPDNAASCGAHVPQSCCPPVGMSKCPLWPPTER